MDERSGVFRGARAVEVEVRPDQHHVGRQLVQPRGVGAVDVLDHRDLRRRRGGPVSGQRHHGHPQGGEVLAVTRRQVGRVLGPTQQHGARPVQHVVETTCAADGPHPPLPGQRASVLADVQAGAETGARWSRSVSGPVLGLQPSIAFGGLVGVGDADDLPQRDREVDERPRVMPSLAGVGVEEVGRRDVTQNGVEFPRQVHRVPQTGAETLAGERGHEVGGITRDHGPAAPPPLRPARLERVHGMPDEGGVLGRRTPRSEERPRGVGGVQGVRVLARESHELPPSPAGAARNHGGRAVGVAPLRRARRKGRARSGFDVDHQPVTGIPVVVPAGVDRVADRAVRTVRADHEPGPHLDTPTALPGALGATAHRHDGAIGTVDEGRHLRPAHDPDVRPGRHHLVEGVLEGRLIEEIRVVPTGFAEPAPVHFHQGLPGPVGPDVHRVVRLGDVRNRLGCETDRLEDAGDVGTVRDGAGQRVGRLGPLHHEHPVPARTELCGDELADRTEADHHHVVLGPQRIGRGPGGPVACTISCRRRHIPRMAKRARQVTGVVPAPGTATGELRRDPG